MSPRRVLSSGKRRGSRGAALLVLAGLLSWGGCLHPGAYDRSRTGPFFSPTNFTADADLGSIRRVVVLPVWTGAAASAETGAQLDPVLQSALQASRRFEVVALSRQESLRRFRAEAVSASGALPHDLFDVLRREFDADAVMFVDLTTYEPYRPLQLGWRAKLALLDGSRLVWTFDEVFSAANEGVANAVRNHYLDADRRAPADLTHGALQSPARFAAYAAAAMFSTLPSVAVSPPAAAQPTPVGP